MQHILIQNQDLRVFYARAILSWGYTIRYKATSAAQPAYALPPPTTIVGAFAYPLTKLLKLNPYRDCTNVSWGKGRIISCTMTHLLDATIMAAAGFVEEDYPTGIAVHQETGRISASMYKGGGERARISAEFMSSNFFTEALPRVITAQAVGAAYGPLVQIDLLWVVNARKLCEKLNITIDEFDEAAQIAVYGLVRLGSKESIVAIDPSKSKFIKNPQIMQIGDKIRTRLYVPKKCVEVLDGELVHEIIIPNLYYSPELYYLPAIAASNLVIFPLSSELAPVFRIINNKCIGVSIGVDNVAGVA